jgi:hypothetical protein
VAVSHALTSNTEKNGQRHGHHFEGHLDSKEQHSTSNTVTIDHTLEIDERPVPSKLSFAARMSMTSVSNKRAGPPVRAVGTRTGDRRSLSKDFPLHR